MVCTKTQMSTSTPSRGIMYQVECINPLRLQITERGFSMDYTSENNPKKNICVGLLAHVDAGKTTLSEALLYETGVIKKPGRVDHGDTFLDHNALEKERGITIFSKQARLCYGDIELVLLDTPGHVDFSAETERTLRVLDYAILIISGPESVQSHTKTLWQLLKRYQVPVFIFVNKMDMPTVSRERVLSQLTSALDMMCVDFSVTDTEAFYENVAMASEEGLNTFLEQGYLPDVQIAGYIKERQLFPCFFGSALKHTGISSLLDGLVKYTVEPTYGDDFAARVYKVSRDARGVRLAHLKITGGSFRVKSVLQINGKSCKIDQMRLYSGEKYQMIEEACAGMICTVQGIEDVYPGMGLGAEPVSMENVLEPVLDYQVLPPEGTDSIQLYGMLKQLAEEDPTLHIRRREAGGEIHIRLMGVVQQEILKRLIFQRFGLEVTFDEGSIMYKETILSPVEGIGHYEPLKHYAEVHLLLEPLPAGSGLVFESACREDVLDRNWQRLILTHLAEREHVGVLTGSVIADMRITVLSGRAHTKHTEGGDFRQATYRAVRQGLKSAKSVLLEPVYQFVLTLPSANVGRAMSDIEQMHGKIEAPVICGEDAELTGTAPVACMRNYQAELAGYTKGAGKCYLTPGGYAPCHNQEEIIAAIGYDSEQDISNPTCSVFCAHGAGFIVPWNQVRDYMHVERGYVRVLDEVEVDGESGREAEGAKTMTAKGGMSGSIEEDRELEAIFNRTFRSSNNDRAKYAGTSAALGHEQVKPVWNPKPKKPRCLLVDGYNVIFAWDVLAMMAKKDLGAARNELMDILCNYQGFTGCLLILVFDAYKVKGNPGSVEKYHNIYVVYTKEAETADMYIEKTAHAMQNQKAQAGAYDVTVATSDALEQLIVMGQGAKRISSRELAEEIQRIVESNMESYRSSLVHEKNLIPVDWERIFP